MNLEFPVVVVGLRVCTLLLRVLESSSVRGGDYFVDLLFVFSEVRVLPSKKLMCSSRIVLNIHC